MTIKNIFFIYDSPFLLPMFFPHPCTLKQYCPFPLSTYFHFSLPFRFLLEISKNFSHVFITIFFLLKTSIFSLSSAFLCPQYVYIFG
ncbi:hypothetical protein Lalb_Chr05g0223271 [Lupinus albus]|uniref:Uncharacterized protein n=1 Tax=Lupinus albus TaxID=3870 RepID=A0A6A4QK26_LUPAL|nr:hypothetical protein Lalb_Chr05g0223271 [Lupinus albus]